MKMKRWIRKIVPIVGAVVFVLFTGITAYADVDTGSLTVDISCDNVGISSAEFEIYKVQQWENPELDQDPEWCGAFAGFGGEEIDGKKIGSLRGRTAKFMRAVAERLESYIGENSISADKTGTTGANGCAEFSSLDPGVYLVIVTQQPKGYIVTSPFLVTVPKIDSEGELNYDVTVKAKIEALPTPTPTSTPKPTSTPTPTATPAPTSTPTPEPSATPGPISHPTPGPTDSPQPVRTPGPTNPPLGPTNPPPAPTSLATPAPSTTPEPTDSPATLTDQPRITNRPNPTPTPDQAVLGMRRRRGWEKGVLGRRRLPQTGTLQWPIPTLAGAGILLFFIGWMRR